MNGFLFEKALKLLVASFSESESLIKPTLFHSVRVGTFLWNMGYDEYIQIAGLLHDILEDTDISEEIIEKEFGKEVLAIVKANTKNMDIEKGKRLEDIVARCYQCGENAIFVKIADIYDNFLFYISEGNIAEIDRCKKLANLVLVEKPIEWNNPIFQKLDTIITYTTI